MVHNAPVPLTRASFSYFALPLFVMILLPEVLQVLRGDCRRSWSRRRWLQITAGFWLPVVLVHGGWTLKNGWVHGHLRVATSTWAGGNAAAGLEQAGMGDAFVSHALAHGDSPDWFKAFHEQRGARPWP